MEPSTLYEVIVKQAVALMNCDGGTFYTPGKGCLEFQYLITKSKYREIKGEFGVESIPSVPLDRKYVCAYAALTKKQLNIRDVYYAKEYDFEGTYLFDRKNNYRTHSMLVMPITTEEGELLGVLQLINAKDEKGNWIEFDEVRSRLVESLAALAAIKMENMKLRNE